MRFCWESLSAPIRSRLLQGGVGAYHLHETAHILFQCASEAEESEKIELYALGCDMLLAAWEAAPLEPSIAATVLTVQEKKAFLDTRLLGIMKFCARQPQPDERASQRMSLQTQRNVKQFQALLLHEQGHTPYPFFLLRQAMETGFHEPKGFYEQVSVPELGVEGQRSVWLRSFVHRDAVLPIPFKTALLADVAFAEGQWSEAATGYAKARMGFPLMTWQVRQAEALYRAGHEDEAIALWTAAHTARPWNVNILLRLSDIREGRDKAGEKGRFPTGTGYVLLYTWNKGADIDATLASVARSELEGQEGEARIIVLDNGSTDSTPEVLRIWEARFQGRMSVVTLPVNVGAPAARNWLLTLPQVRQASWAAFLDDDVAVPRTWLRHLQAGLEAYPQSGVCSGHAVDLHAPMSQQWTDMHLVPQRISVDESKRGFHDLFKFTSLHEQCFDFGEFNFMRPCVTAIGCCHMFTREAMDEGGAFDVRFSPSQSDDVDHDMRRGLSGHLPVFNGHLRVLHRRSTGYHKRGSRRSWASAVGNWYKLQASYSPEEVQTLYNLDQQVMLEDVLKRVEKL